MKIIKNLSYVVCLAVSFSTGFSLINYEASASVMLQSGGSVCVTNDFAKDHCVANSDGTGDSCSKTVQTGPLCSGTATPVIKKEE